MMAAIFIALGFASGWAACHVHNIHVVRHYKVKANEAFHEGFRVCQKGINK